MDMFSRRCVHFFFLTLWITISTVQCREAGKGNLLGIANTKEVVLRLTGCEFMTLFAEVRQNYTVAVTLVEWPDACANDSLKYTDMHAGKSCLLIQNSECAVPGEEGLTSADQLCEHWTDTNSSVLGSSKVRADGDLRILTGYMCHGKWPYYFAMKNDCSEMIKLHLKVSVSGHLDPKLDRTVCAKKSDKQSLERMGIAVLILLGVGVVVFSFTQYWNFCPRWLKRRFAAHRYVPPVVV